MPPGTPRSGAAGSSRASQAPRQPELRAELVAKREAGTTLAKLKKVFPQVAPEVIRAVLPPLPKGHRPQARHAQATGRQARADGRQAGGDRGQGQGKAAAPKPAGNGGTTDKERLALARKVVALRAQDGLSWLKIGAKLELAPEAESAKAGASPVRTLHRLVKGQDASTGSLVKQ
jgi:hypothetical protein